jgi:hypothetical protein
LGHGPAAVGLFCTDGVGGVVWRALALFGARAGG